MSAEPGSPLGTAVVIGAGIAGTTAAYELERAGAAVTVLESTSTVGGRMATVERNGYLMDTGAYLLSEKYEQMLALIDRIGRRDLLVDSTDLIAIRRAGVEHHLRGTSIADAARTRLLSARGKLAAARMMLAALRLAPTVDWFELASAAAADRESAAQFALRVGNQELLDYVVDPALRFAFMDDVHRISAVDLLFALDKFFGAGLFTLRGGVGALPVAIAAQLDDVRLGAQVTSVEEDAAEVRVTYTQDGRERTISSDACVITLAAPLMASIYPQLDRELRFAADRMRYIRYLVPKLALHSPPAERAVSIGIPSREHADLCTLSFDHNKAPDRCPPGKGMVSVYWHVDWTERHWDASDEEIAAASAAAAASVLGPLEVEFCHVTRWDPAWILPVPGGGYRDMQAFADARHKARRVHLAGDYFGGSTTNSALCSGQRAAEHALTRLRAGRARAAVLSGA